MKKLGMLLLLISLGLNLGLGLRLLGKADPPDRPGGSEGGRGRRGESGWQRHASEDSTEWRRYMGRRIERLAQRLELRPDQIDQLRLAQHESFRQMRDRRRALFQARGRLRELMSAGEIDRPAVRRAMVELGRRQADLDSLAAETVLGELEILDSQQRVRYLEFLPDGAGSGQGRGRHGQRSRVE